MTIKIPTRSCLTAVAIILGVALQCSGQQVSLSGAGSTFVSPMFSKWFDEYHRIHPNVQIKYQAVGSGLGFRRLTDGEVDFADSDAPLSDFQIANLMDRYGGRILHFPTVVGAVVPAYNVPGIAADINFTPDALVGIFLGRITKWNDPELVKANPKLKLPSSDIITIHRSDDSGTTYVWSDYLSKVSFEYRTKLRRDTLVNWPNGRAGSGNQGVSELIRQTPYSLGYVELTYAMRDKLSFGPVANASGAFVKADLASVTAAADTAAPFAPEDFRFSIANSPAKNAYPISSFTWLVVPADIKDKAKRDAIKELIRWILGPGQDMAATVRFSRLPRSIIAGEVQNTALFH